MSITQFKVHIPDSELDLLRRKLEIARIPKTNVDWREENGIDSEFIEKVVQFWLNEYDWRAEEAKINDLPQYMTQIELEDGFGTLDVHFVHSLSSEAKSIPLLFIHGWPGSFIEITKSLPQLNKAGFHVVAPSLPGYGFSSYSRKKGFDIRQHAKTFQKLMVKLGYDQFVVQGGDWGSHITRAMGLLFPENVKALHLNMLQLPELKFPEGEPEYSAVDKQALDRFFNWFMPANTAYSFAQATKPITLGMGMHDSPVAMLSWMIDKLVLWSDAYPWTHTEMITWTLLHYFPGPTTGFMMYHENNMPATAIANSWAQEYIRVPCGFSYFPREIAMMPRSWAERVANVQFWRNHTKGGHFAMYERPEEMATDVVEFFKSVV